jgi:uncharacterized protein with GYD domain
LTERAETSAAEAGSDPAVGGHSILMAPPFSRRRNTFIAMRKRPRQWVARAPGRREGNMPTFILSVNWTDQGIRGVKEAPKRSAAARALGKKLSIDIKQIYMTTGASDLMIILEAPDGDSVVKFAMATGALGNVRTTTARAWNEKEFMKLISELP